MISLSFIINYFIFSPFDIIKFSKRGGEHNFLEKLNSFYLKQFFIMSNKIIKTIKWSFLLKARINTHEWRAL